MKVRLECPICGASLGETEDPLDGELFECPECGSMLELMTDGEEWFLVEAEEIGEDWGE
ncbi:sulfonate ABC transporter [archaeon]|nr:MAG: sulfonate ABC transporter [archaeon]